MPSSTYALLWEIWRRHRVMIAVIIGLTVSGRLLDVSERAMAGDAGVKSSLLVELLWMVSFLLLFGVFNYTDSSGSRGFGRFPHRLFVLPVSTLRLVAVPMLTGVASVELLYLLWHPSLSVGGSMSSPFAAVLLGGLMVFYLAILWTLERLGPLRVVVMGAAAVMLFATGLLPSFPSSPPPPWRSEGAVAAWVVGVAVVVFVVVWRHVASLRCGGARRARWLESLTASAAAAIPTRRKAFASPLAAHFWFEWRCSGLALPMVVGAVLLVVFVPLSWVLDDAGGSFRLLFAALATPVILAIPIGMAFARPTFWSEDLSVPEFVAVRPLTDDDIVATKIKVAIASVVVSWVLVLLFCGIWLFGWANLDSLSRVAIVLWAFHGRSVAAVVAIAVLIVAAGMLLTWRFLASRLWTGLSGSRPLFIASVMFVVFVAVGSLVFDVTRLPGWVLDDPARMAAAAWVLAIAVIAKYWLAAFSWRRVSARYMRQYLLLWGPATACLLTLSLVFWGVVRIYVALDIYRFQALVVLAALLALPLCRVGLAAACLTRNRHR
jgi:hypothetical protein